MAKMSKINDLILQYVFVGKLYLFIYFYLIRQRSMKKNFIQPIGNYKLFYTYVLSIKNTHYNIVLYKYNKMVNYILNT